MIFDSLHELGITTEIAPVTLLVNDTLQLVPLLNLDPVRIISPVVMLDDDKETSHGLLDASI